MSQRLGYEPYYFYAGSGQWHDLEGLTRKLGYKKFLGRHSFDGYEQNKYGFYDEDFFNCPCQPGCPNGCPCDAYANCPIETTTPPIKGSDHCKAP